jgi:predicted MPP superfamily phosphohydrolase
MGENKLRTISIGDIHGVDYWNQINPELYDKIIFLGDYVDSFNIKDEDILNNLLNIIQFKKDNIDKVVLLWGNHDCQYAFNNGDYMCSGFRQQMFDTLNKIFNDNFDLFQMSYEINDTIWTHAGIHQGWYNQRFLNFAMDFPKEKLSGQLNIAFKLVHNPLFDVGHMRGGDYNVGGPLWCDTTELNNKPLKTMNQVVGHNRKNEIYKIYKHNKEIVYTDCLQNRIQFYEKTFVI